MGSAAGANDGNGVIGISDNFDGTVGSSQTSNGVHGLSTSGDGVMGESFEGTGVHGKGGPTGVQGEGDVIAVNGQGGEVGVQGNADILGVIGQATNIGVMGVTGPEGTGVLGSSTNGHAVEGNSDNGVWNFRSFAEWHRRFGIYRGSRLHSRYCRGFLRKGCCMGGFFCFRGQARCGPPSRRLPSAAVFHGKPGELV